MGGAVIWKDKYLFNLSCPTQLCLRLNFFMNVCFARSLFVILHICKIKLFVIVKEHREYNLINISLYANLIRLKKLGFVIAANRYK